MPLAVIIRTKQSCHKTKLNSKPTWRHWRCCHLISRWGWVYRRMLESCFRPKSFLRLLWKQKTARVLASDNSSNAQPQKEKWFSKNVIYFVRYRNGEGSSIAGPRTSSTSSSHQFHFSIMSSNFQTRAMASSEPQQRYAPGNLLFTNALTILFW